MLSLCEQALVKGGSDVDAQDAQGMSAMHAAAKYGRLACAEFLIYAGARLPTPLSATFAYGAFTNGVLLCRLHIRDAHGRTALDFPHTKEAIERMLVVRRQRRMAWAEGGVSEKRKRQGAEVNRGVFRKLPTDARGRIAQFAGLI